MARVHELLGFRCRDGARLLAEESDKSVVAAALAHETSAWLEHRVWVQRCEGHQLLAACHIACNVGSGHQKRIAWKPW
jgi:hypothetical protein